MGLEAKGTNMVSENISSVSWAEVIEIHDSLVAEIRADPASRPTIENRFYEKHPYLKPDKIDKLRIKGSCDAAFTEHEVLSFQQVAVNLADSEIERNLHRQILNNSHSILTGERQLDPLHIKIADSCGGTAFITHIPDAAYKNLRTTALKAILLTKCFDIYLLAFSQKCTYSEARKLILFDAVCRFTEIQPFLVQFILDGLRSKLTSAIEDLIDELRFKVMGRMGLKVKDPSFFLTLSNNEKERKARTEQFKTRGKRGPATNQLKGLSELRTALKRLKNKNARISRAALGREAWEINNASRAVSNLLDKAGITWEEFVNEEQG
jgi:hypothetical protein